MHPLLFLLAGLAGLGGLYASQAPSERVGDRAPAAAAALAEFHQAAIRAAAAAPALPRDQDREISLSDLAPNDWRLCDFGPAGSCPIRSYIRAGVVTTWMMQPPPGVAPGQVAAALAEAAGGAPDAGVVQPDGATWRSIRATASAAMPMPAPVSAAALRTAFPANWGVPVPVVVAPPAGSGAPGGAGAPGGGTAPGGAGVPGGETSGGGTPPENVVTLTPGGVWLSVYQPPSGGEGGGGGGNATWDLLYVTPEEAANLFPLNNWQQFVIHQGPPAGTPFLARMPEGDLRMVAMSEDGSVTLWSPGGSSGADQGASDGNNDSNDSEGGCGCGSAGGEGAGAGGGGGGGGGGGDNE